MKNFWYPHYAGDYARDTGHLSLIQHGAYRQLLDHAYMTAAPLPSDPAALYRICRAFTEEERQAVDSVISQFFKLQADGYHNPRADRQLLQQAEHRERLSNSGKRGAQKRWGQDGQANGQANGHPNGEANGPALANPKSNSNSNLNSKSSSPNSSGEADESSPNRDRLDDFKKQVLAKCTDPGGQLAIALDVIMDRARRSGQNVTSSKYLEVALERFDFQGGQDREDWMAASRGRIGVR